MIPSKRQKLKYFKEETIQRTKKLLWTAFRVFQKSDRRIRRFVAHRAGLWHRCHRAGGDVPLYLGRLVFHLHSGGHLHQHLLYVAVRPSEGEKEHPRHLSSGAGLRPFCPLHRRHRLRIGGALLGDHRHFADEEKGKRTLIKRHFPSQRSLGTTAKKQGSLGDVLTAVERSPF